METKNLENFLKSFGDNVVKEAKANLAASKDSMGKARGNTALGQSIRVEVVPTATGFSTQFYMLDYGEYLDKGVRGTKSNYIENSKTDYSYTTKQPPSGIIEKWIKRKGIKGRVDKDWKSAGNRGGQFITNKSLAFLIARSVKQKGIKSLSFFQKPLGFYYKELKEDMVKELKLDIESYLTTFYRPK
jgi:hypothetical protein